MTGGCMDVSVVRRIDDRFLDMRMRKRAQGFVVKR
jgi:hypothetical protein